MNKTEVNKVLKKLAYEIRLGKIAILPTSTIYGICTNALNEESVRKIIDIILNTDKDFDRVKFEEKIAITLACKMSIKANHHISMEEITYILDELVKCDNPYNCPHGRPTIIKFSIYDLEKMFKRVMD